MSGGYYDDNFGSYSGMDPDDPDFEDNLDFYRQVQAESVDKVCRGCRRTVRLRPDYAYCNGCADLIEKGMDLG